MEKRIEQLEKTVSDLKEQVAALTATVFNPREAAEMMVNASKGKSRKRGVSAYS